jgi:hypothetical protein
MTVSYCFIEILSRNKFQASKTNRMAQKSPPTSVVAHRGEAKKRYETGSRHSHALHTACQYIVDMCAEPQIASKLLDSEDDNLSVSGMHTLRMGAILRSRILTRKVWSHMINQTTTTPEYDLNRIDSIRTQLNEDDYFVDTLQIADKFIDLEIALAGSN